MNLQINKRSLDELYEMIHNIDREKYPAETSAIESRISEITKGIPTFNAKSAKRILGYETTPPFKFSGQRILYFPDAINLSDAVNVFVSEFKKSNAESTFSEGNTVIIPRGFHFFLNQRHPLNSINKAKIVIDVNGNYMSVYYEFEEFGKSRLLMLTRIVALAAIPCLLLWITNYSILALLASIPFVIFIVVSTGFCFAAIVNRAVRKCQILKSQPLESESSTIR